MAQSPDRMTSPMESSGRQLTTGPPQMHDRGIVHRPDLNIPRADRLRSDFDYHQAGRMTSVWPVLATSPHRLNARRSVDSRCGRGRSIQPRSRRPAGRWTGNLSGRRGHTLCRPATNECVPAVRQCGPELVGSNWCAPNKQYGPGMVSSPPPGHDQADWRSSYAWRGRSATRRSTI